MKFLTQTLAHLEDSGLLRELRRVDGSQGPTLRIDGRECACFCSNNYLSFASRPELVRAAAHAAEKLGCGSGASRLVSGNMALHEELEAAIAKLKERPAAILFPTGYMANIGTISALVSSGDAVIVDKLDHASIIDGCRLSGAKMLVYHHCDPNRLDAVLRRAASFRRKLVITDSVFSMDGDVAPLPDIAEVCEKHQAMLMIDEAHATGVLGPTGRGSEEHFGIIGGERQLREPPIIMGTLSKAVGSLGGFVAGSSELIDYLRNTARSFIYTTALPPPVCAASLAGLKLIETDRRPLERLRRNIALFDELLRDISPPSEQPFPPLSEESCSPPRVPIFPIRVTPAHDTRADAASSDDVEIAVTLARALLKAGYLCPAIRPPTVPAGSSRLRVTLQAGHTKEHLRGFAAALKATPFFCARHG